MIHRGRTLKSLPPLDTNMKELSIAALIKGEGRLRKKNESATAALSSIEKQIQELEAQLRNTSGESSEESSEESDSASEKEGIEDNAADVLIEADESGNVVKYVSALSSERIEPLKKELLPAADCGTSKSKRHRESDESTNGKRKGVIRFADEIEKGRSIRDNHLADKSRRSGEVNRGEGMEKTIKELLNNYEPSSVNRLPFWCRVCKFQGKDAQDLLNHRETEFHKAAVRMEKKMSYCQLCRKQFTSPVQLQEHLKAKGHKDRLGKVRVANQRNAQFR